MSEKTGGQSPQIDEILRYFRNSNKGSPDFLAPFANDFEFYFPKFGIGRGKDEFMACAVGLLSTIGGIVYHVDRFTLHEAGNVVTVEGFTSGEGTDGRTWSGGETPGGRFCSVFEFKNGLISRMYLYLDPDYTSKDSDRFLWGTDGRRW